MEGTAEASPVTRTALMGEIIGATVVVSEAPGIRPLPLEGTIVNETLGLLWVRRRDGARVVKVPKAGLAGTILLEEKQLPLSGELLRVRPEDRTKRLAVRAPRRFP